MQKQQRRKYDEKELAIKINLKKTIHTELPVNIHRKLRANLFLKEISIQEFFKLVSEAVVNDDYYINQMIEERVDNIKNKKLDKLRNINKKDLYNAIEENSPLKDKDN